MSLVKAEEKLRKNAFNHVCREVCWEGLSFSECKKEKCDLYELAVELSVVVEVFADLKKQLRKAIKNRPFPVEGVLGYVYDGDQIDDWFVFFKKKVLGLGEEEPTT